MRIASLSPAVTETLVELGLEEELVAVTPFCRPWLSGRKEIAGSYTSISIERLKRLNPDVVFLQSRVQDRLYEEVKSSGLRAYLVPLPSNVYGIIQNVGYVGSITGRYLEAKELSARLLKKLERIKDNLSVPPKERVRVYVEYLWPDWTYCAAASLSFVDDGVWWAGGINIFYDRAEAFFTPRDEEIMERDPEVVLVNVEQGMRVSAEDYVERRGLGDLRAVREGRVRLVPETREVNLAHSGPSFITTIIWLSNLLKNLRREDG